MNQPHVYYSQLYRNFRAIEPVEYRKIVYFYERHESEIKLLDFPEYFELLNAYTKALFEIEGHQKHLMMADAVIELSFEENIVEINGQEIFQATLFRKAASFYQLQQFPKAIYVLTELIKIDPEDTHVTHFLERCLRKSRPKFVRSTRAIAIFIFLATAFVISIEALFVRPFFPNWMFFVESIRNTSFVLGIFILGIGEIIHFLKARHDVLIVVNSAKKSRLNN